MKGSKATPSEGLTCKVCGKDKCRYSGSKGNRRTRRDTCLVEKGER